MFQGHRRAKGFRVSSDRGFPLAGRGFQEVWRLQNPRVNGSKGPLRGHGFKGLMNRRSKQFQGSQGSKGPRVNGSRGLIGSNEYQRSTGFRVSRDRGFPLAGRCFQEVWRLQNPRVSEINGSKGPLRGHGFKVPMSKVLKVSKS